MNESRANHDSPNGDAPNCESQIRKGRRGFRGLKPRRSCRQPATTWNDPIESRRVTGGEHLDLVDDLMRKAMDLIVGAGVPAWAIERMHLFQTPNDYRIVACVSEYARANQGIADLSALEIGIHCELPELYVEARTEALIAAGCLLCDARDGDRYFLQVPQRPPLQMHSD